MVANKKHSAPRRAATPDEHAPPGDSSPRPIRCLTALPLLVALPSFLALAGCPSAKPAIPAAAATAAPDSGPCSTDTGAAAAAPSDAARTPPDAARTPPDAAPAPAPETSSPDAAPADLGPPPAPLSATGKLVDRSDLLPAFALDPGKKGGSPPESSAFLAGDTDGDGDLDLIATDGIDTVSLGRQSQPWVFDWSTLATVPYKGLHSLAWLEVDGDDLPELVAVGSYVFLWARTGPQAPWVEQAKARGLGTPPNVALESALPVDLDSDGLLDFVAANFTCDPTSAFFAWVNQGNGKFALRTPELGLDHKASLWGALASDIDGDRHMDLLLLAESCDPKGGSAYLRNRGFPIAGKLFEYKPLPPVFTAPALAPFGSPMGGAVADFNGDGLLDLVLAEIGLRDLRMGGMDPRKPGPGRLAAHPDESTHLLLRQPNGSFTSAQVAAGIVMPLSATGQTMVSWTALPWDFDGDGRADLLLTHGWDFGAFALADEGGARPVLYRNQGNGTFADVGAAFGLPAQFVGKAATLADLDGDGDLDLALGGQSEAPRLFRNDVLHKGQRLRVRLRGTVSNPWGLGARLRLKTTLGERVAEMNVQAPSETTALPEVWFTWPSGEAPQSLHVAWPSGFDQVAAVPDGAQALTVEEPPLVKLSARHTPASVDAIIEVKARAYEASGKIAQIPLPTSIEMAAGSKGSWTGPTQCAPNGECVRVWKPLPTGAGEAVIVVAFGGKALLVRPRLRFTATSLPQP
ncbi:MAG: VCBS repeat-containing protein [Myxococcales bacterium]|nr:VCBS repeat-containing protein [Myxococcales bacterium]